MGRIGLAELLVILAIVIILMGPAQIPKLIKIYKENKSKNKNDSEHKEDIE